MPRADEFPEILARRTGREPLRNVLLRDCSSFRIGGPADFFFKAESRDELKAALSTARLCGVPSYIIGGGFNILFDDAGFRGLILRNASRGLSIDPSAPRLRAESGTALGALVEFAVNAGLERVEFLAGIPGSVGGAVYGNAGAFGHCLGDSLAEILLLAPGGSERRAPAADLGFSYRHSNLKGGREVVLDAVFDLKPGSADVLRSRVNDCLGLRAQKHPPKDMAYAGSYFKNPVSPDGTRTPAGRLLEQVGAKEARVGGAAVYSGHGNFLYNAGGATAADILALAAMLKARVRDAFGVELEEEVVYLPAAAGSP